MRKLCLAFLALLALTTPSHAYLISDDPGGRIVKYIEEFKEVRESGEPVKIDGKCVSACTLVLGIVPRNRICVTKRAVFGFHAAWSPQFFTGRPIRSDEGTQVLWDIYPSRVKHMITMRGGLTEKMIWVRGQELALYRACR